MSNNKQKMMVIGLTLSLMLLTGCSNTAQPKLVPDEPNETLQEEPTITLYLHETGETQSVPLEEYLCGVVAAEMAVDWPEEALAAQAIMARTFTLEKIAAGGVEARGTDASTDINEFQAYDATKINDAVKGAVEKTRGQTVRYQGEWVKAWFFADGGGKTAASSEEGLGYTKTPTPYIRSVDDPGIQLADNPNKGWEATFTIDQVKDAVNQVTGQPLAQIDQVNIAETGSSGRATALQIGNTTVSAPAFRLAIGSETMKSTLLDSIILQENHVVMTGKGYGHGVGMSQWGARALAEQGKSAEEIVKYFLKDVELSQEYQ